MIDLSLPGYDILITWFCGLFALIGTWIAGYPLLSLLKSGGTGFTRHILGFGAGISLISLSGFFSLLFGINPIILQMVVIFIGAGIFSYLLYQKRLVLTSPDLSLLIPAGVFCLIFWTFFSFIGFWMGGDGIAHASIIQLLMDNKDVPVSFPPFGSYWEYYPKGFHLYTLPFASIFGSMQAIMSIPVFLAAAIPVTLSAILVHCNRRTAAWFTLVGGLFCIPQIWAALIWAGYPSLTAGLLIVCGVLAYLVDKKLVVLFCLAILVIHAREALLFVAAIGGIAVAEWYYHAPSGRKKTGFMIILGIASALLGVFGLLHSTGTLLITLSDPGSFAMQLIRYYWVFPVIFGFGLLLFNEGREREIILGWSCGLSFFLLLVMAMGLESSFPPVRILTDLTIPLAALFGITLAALVRGFAVTIDAKQGRCIGLVLLLLIGMVITGGIFGYYYMAWALPREDYSAMLWLSQQDYSDGLVINVDETGGLAYPMAGIAVSHPRVVPGIEVTNPIYTPPWTMESLHDVDKVRNLTGEYDPVLVYVSSTSLLNPGYTSPFSEYPYPYPDGTISLPGDYSIIYDEGTRIYLFTR